jgi:hypothetical protein
MTTPLQYGMGGERQYDLYYRHSGFTPVPAIAIAAVGGLVAGVILAVIYTYIIQYVPFIKLRFLATLGFGAAVGAVTAAIAKAGRVRSMAILLAVVAVVTLVAYYFCWVYWTKVTFDRALANEPGYNLTLGRLITHPKILWNAVEIVYENGTWAASQHDKESTKGTFLGIIWLVEALTIFAMSFIAAAATFGKDMFCEDCRRWCGKARTIRSIAPGDANRARQSLEAHDFSYLNSLSTNPDAGHFWTLEHQRCGVCDRLHALSVVENKVTLDKKGKVTGKTAKRIIDRLLITPEEVQALAGPPAPPPQWATQKQPPAPPSIPLE